MKKTSEIQYCNNPKKSIFPLTLEELIAEMKVQLKNFKNYGSNIFILTNKEF